MREGGSQRPSLGRPQERAVRELGRGPVVILAMEYPPEVAVLDRHIFLLSERLTQWLGTGPVIKTVLQGF